MINFISYINQNTPQLTAQQKQKMLDDFVEFHGYSGLLPPLPTKADYANMIITNFLKNAVERTRIKQIQTEIEVLDI